MRKFVVWRPDYGSTFEDGRTFEATSAEAAARDWAEREDADSADYTIVSGNDATLHVANPDRSDEQVFIVSGESVPLYRARLKT